MPCKSISVNYGTSNEAKSYSLQVSERREPIIFPEEFATLTDIVLVTPYGFCRVEKMPFFDTGNRANREAEVKYVKAELPQAVIEIPTVKINYVNSYSFPQEAE